MTRLDLQELLDQMAPDETEVDLTAEEIVRRVTDPYYVPKLTSEED